VNRYHGGSGSDILEGKMNTTSTPQSQTLPQVLKTTADLMMCIGGITVSAALLLEACAAVIQFFRR
jgi:hypothetical protein